MHKQKWGRNDANQPKNEHFHESPQIGKFMRQI